MPRKKSSKQAPATPVRVKKKKPHTLHDKDLVDSMPPPNGLVPKEPNRFYRWPMMMLRHPSKKTERLVGAFVHECHGVDHWIHWKDHPPSWMDPILFSRMCRKDERVQKLLQLAFDKNNPAYARKLESLLQEIFEEKYLPLMFHRFEGVKSLIADYLVRHHAEREVAKPKPKKTTRRRKPS